MMYLFCFKIKKKERKTIIRKMNRFSNKKPPEKEDLVLKKGLPISKLRQDISKFHVGDKVKIPRNLLPDDSTASNTDYVNAKIETICRHHIVYRLLSGTHVSLDYFDSLQIIITEPFSSYTEEQQLSDLADGMAAAVEYKKSCHS